MSKNLDLEGDSPNSSIHLGNDDIDGLNNDITLKLRTRARTLKFLSHISESVHSVTPFLHPSTDESVNDVSETRIHRTTDLVRQPSRWGVGGLSLPELWDPLQEGVRQPSNQRRHRTSQFIPFRRPARQAMG